MNSKSRYFSSLLIAIVAAFGYYILTDFNISDIQLKTFSSLGVPFRMYQINNTVKQKKLSLPKVIYSYANQQDVLKAPKVDLIVESESDAEEFIAGLTGALVDAEKKTTKERQPKINDKYKYGTDDETPEIITPPTSLPVVTTNGKTPCPNVKVQEKITYDDIEMIVTTVATQNVKKIEECFKKIKVIYGEDRSLKNIIISGTQNINRESRGSVVNSGTTVTETRRMLKAAPVVIEEDEDDSEEDTEN
jgi:DNA-binding protein YbaB